MVCESTSPNIAASRPGHSAYVQRRRLNRFLLTINTTHFIFNKRVMNQTFVFPLTDRFYIFPTRVSDPRYVDRSSRFDYPATGNPTATRQLFDTDREPMVCESIPTNILGSQTGTFGLRTAVSPDPLPHAHQHYPFHFE